MPAVSAILLAAGSSTRMGTCKQLLPLGDTTVLARCLDTLRCGGVDDIVVVVSARGEDVARDAEGCSVRVVVNREEGGDMSSSIRAGREALGPDCDRVIVALCDYPLVTAATISSMISRSSELSGAIIIPEYQGRRGHPLLFPRHILDELEADMTLRDVVRRTSSRVCPTPVDDPGILLDMDTPEDYQYIRTVLNQSGFLN